MKIVRNKLTPQSMRAVAVIAVLATVGSIVSIVIGCSGDDNRIPTKSEVQQADVKRQSYIDTLNVSDEQKAIMKSHMGGQPATDPAMAAQKAAAPKDRR